MPVTAILGLVFSAIKATIEIVAWLKAHPEVTAGARERLQTLSERLEDARSNVVELENTLTTPHHVEAP